MAMLVFSRALVALAILLAPLYTYTSAGLTDGKIGPSLVARSNSEKLPGRGLLCNATGYKVLDVDAVVEAVTGGKNGLKGTQITRIMHDAIEYNFLPVGVYFSDSSPRRAVVMIHKYSGLKYVHFFDNRNNYRSSFLLNAVIPELIYPESKVNTVNNLVSGDLCVETSVQDMHLRNILDEVPDFNGWHLRDVTQMGVMLGYQFDNDFCDGNGIARSFKILDRIIQIISKKLEVYVDPDHLLHDLLPTTVRLSADGGEKFSKAGVDTLAGYAVLEAVYRRMSVLDVTFSSIYRIVNKGTIYQGIDPYMISGDVESMTEPLSKADLVDTAQKMYNPLRMTMYLTGLTDLVDALGSNTYAEEYFKGEPVNYSRYTGIRKRYFSDKAWAEESIYVGPDLTNTQPRVAIPEVLNVLPSSFLTQTLRRLPYDEDEPKKPRRMRKLASVSIVYVFNGYFAGKSPIHGLLFKMLIKQMFKSGPSHLEDIKQDLLKYKTVARYIWMFKGLYISGHYEYGRPFLLFTFADKAGGRDNRKKRFVADATKIAKIIDEVMGSDQTQLYKKLLVEGQSNENLLRDMLLKAVEAFYHVQTEDKDDELLYLKMIADLESLGYGNFCGMDDEIMSTVDEIVEENGGSLAKYFENLFHQSDTLKQNATLYPIVVLEHDRQGEMKKIIQSVKGYFETPTGFFLSRSWKESDSWGR